MRTKLFLFFMIATAISGASNAQSAANAANEKRCKDLSADVQATYQASIEKRIPKTDPGTAVQESHDVKGLMNTDATAGLAKLGGLNFGSIMDKIVGKALSAASAKSSAAYNNKMNEILKGAGVKGVSFQNSVSAGGFSGGVNAGSVSGLAPSINTGALVGGAAAAAKSSAYSRPSN